MDSQLTGALSHVLPIMIAVMISKWVADAFGPDGIYASWIALRRYPWLAPIEFRDNGEIAADAITPVNNLIVLQGVSPLGELSQYCVFLFGGVTKTTGLTRLFEQEDYWKRGSTMAFRL